MDMTEQTAKSVRAVERSLKVLEIMNRTPVVKVGYLASETGIPASTIVRLLETLISAGYVAKLGRSAGYTVTEKVAGLGAGYRGLPQVFDRARRAAQELTKLTQWPAAIATLDVDALVIRYSTIPMSPLSYYQSTINRRMTLLEYAHGRAYLSFCPPAEQSHLLEILKQAAPDKAAAQRIEVQAATVVEQTLASGFGERNGNIQPETHSIALPLRVEGRIVGTLGLTYYARTKVDPNVLKQELKRAVRQIESVGQAPE